MKAILEVEFDKDIMMDDFTVNKEFKGSWFNAMKWLYDEDGISIFENNIKSKI